MNGAEYIVQQLERRGTETLFGYPGGCIMPLYDALIGSRVNHILCRHEQGAAFAADGYARASGRTGVCLATSGPGATNLMTGLADAYMDSVPMVAITGQVPTSLIGTDAFQEIDILGMSLPVTKHSFLVESIDDLPDILEQAFHLAAEGRPGPVLIDLPKDIQLSEMPELPACQPASGEHPCHTSPPSDGLIARARKLMQGSRRPLIYAGGGITRANAVEHFRDFAECCGIPVVMTLKGLGCLPADHTLNLGMLGMHGSRAANMSVQQADLLIAIGARFDDRVTGRLDRFAPDARVIHLDIDPAEMGKLRRVDCAIQGDLTVSMDSLCQRLDLAEWQAHCRRMAEEDGSSTEECGPLIQPAAFIEKLAAQADAGAIISCDVGQHQMWVAQHYPISHPRRHLTSGGLGAMGFGLPAAIGAQCANPGSQVINIAGDGSFMMNLQEMATLTRYRLPVKMIILDNQGLGMVRQQQELCYQGRYTEVDLSDNPEFTRIARAMGIPAEQITSAGEMEGAVERLLECEGPALLQVSIATEENVWPMVKPGDANEQMITGATA
jgi:acetolactate synthase-1/2/3 large subunit